jgi:mono/diheme cytochrome c family protein
MSLQFFYKSLLYSCLALLSALFLSGCSWQQQIAFQPRYDPLEKSDFFDDGLSARPMVPNTVARGQLQDDEHLYSGRVNGELAETFPFAITAEVLERGQERYNIYCAPCHSQIGDGNGMIVQRGFPAPTTFHSERLREAAPGYYFDVMTNGFGVMYNYASRVKPEDRWAIAGYIRALQLSQNTTLDDVPAEERPKLEGTE